MTRTFEELFRCSLPQEGIVFQVANLMRPYVEDLYSINYAFGVFNARDQVRDDIWALRDRSCQEVARLFTLFSRSIDPCHYVNEARSIVFPFLQDQFEVRLRLLNVYWECLKQKTFPTFYAPDLEGMGRMIGSLSALIQECANMECEALSKPEVATAVTKEVT